VECQTETKERFQTLDEELKGLSYSVNERSVVIDRKIKTLERTPRVTVGVSPTFTPKNISSFSSEAMMSPSILPSPNTYNYYSIKGKRSTTTKQRLEVWIIILGIQRTSGDSQGDKGDVDVSKDDSAVDENMSLSEVVSVLDDNEGQSQSDRFVDVGDDSLHDTNERNNDLLAFNVLLSVDELRTELDDLPQSGCIDLNARLVCEINSNKEHDVNRVPEVDEHE